MRSPIPIPIPIATSRENHNAIKFSYESIARFWPVRVHTSVCDDFMDSRQQLAYEIQFLSRTLPFPLVTAACSCNFCCFATVSRTRIDMNVVTRHRFGTKFGIPGSRRQILSEPTRRGKSGDPKQETSKRAAFWRCARPRAKYVAEARHIPRGFLKITPSQLESRASVNCALHAISSSNTTATFPLFPLAINSYA